MFIYAPKAVNIPIPSVALPVIIFESILLKKKLTSYEKRMSAYINSNWLGA